MSEREMRAVLREVLTETEGCSPPTLGGRALALGKRVAKPVAGALLLLCTSGFSCYGVPPVDSGDYESDSGLGVDSGQQSDAGPAQDSGQAQDGGFDAGS